MRVATWFWCALVVVLCGCSDATRPPARFSTQLSLAQRVEATNRLYGVGWSLTRADTDALISAIKSARKNRMGAPGWTKSPRRWDVEFQEGSNQVLVVSISYDVFGLGGIEYRDGSGVVRSFYDRWEKEAMR